MTTVNGVVEAKARTGKSIKVGEGWYSAFSASTLNGVEKGDEVSFEFVQKGEFKNIKGAVRKTASGDGGGASSPSSGGAPRSGGGGSGGGFKGRTFPVGPLDPDRAIIRQNALQHASRIVARTIMSAECNLENVGTDTIELARMFEAYAAGDLDAEEAKAAVSKMSAAMAAGEED